jgi:eukaryotic-like serine/threonine-protein kinase
MEPSPPEAPAHVTHPRLLVIDAERELRAWLRHHIEILWPGARVEELEPAQVAAQLEDGMSWRLDLIVLGTQCRDGTDDPSLGLELLRGLRRVRHAPPIVVVATGGNELSAVQAMRLGAADYLPRRLLDAQRLANALRTLLRPERANGTEGALKRARRRIGGGQFELPHYSILHKLGESARSGVYLAHSAALGRNVALKISRPSADTPEECQEFAREYAAISAVNHRSVVRIFDYGFHDGREYIAMEYFPCGDLKTRLQQPLSPTEALDYAQRICAALQVIHSAGLIHRDLKPPNVMLREDGAVVLIDFGLAKGVDLGGQSTAAGVLRGSPYYMSPEQAQGDALDARSDLYSLGVMLYEMLSGTKPYIGGSAVEVMQQHVRGERPALPAEYVDLEPLLDKLMARDREQRFEDAAQGHAALLEAINRRHMGAPRLEAVVGLP